MTDDTLKAIALAGTIAFLLAGGLALFSGKPSPQSSSTA